jgi:Flp pilus assembly protein TadG
MRNLFHRRQGQSFVEFALAIPILILSLLGAIELAFVFASYLNFLDLSREAARFASVRDPFSITSLGDSNCSTQASFNFYYDTTCIFSPLPDSSLCTDATFCNGFNSYTALNPATDDVIVSVFTVTANQVTNTWPAAGPYALSNHDTDTAHNDNWKKSCNGQLDASRQPFFTAAVVNSYMNPNAVPVKGFVAVEAYFCHHQVLNLPILTNFVPSMIPIHVHTIMQLPAAQPTPTPVP